MNRRLFFVFGLFLSLSLPTQSEAARCSLWLKRAGSWIAKPLEPLYLKRLSLKAFGEEKFFQIRSGKIEPRFHRFEDYILSHPESLISEPLKKDCIRLALTYRHVDVSERYIFHAETAERILEKNWQEISLADIKTEIQKNSERIRSHLSQVHIKEPRSFVRFGMKYKWLILGTTVFVLWDPVQAEIRSWVYWAFNSTSEVFEQKHETHSSSRKAFENSEIDDLQEKIKSQLRSLYFDTNDRYPTTMQMSRNNLSYVYDMIQKRRDELESASQRNDEVLIQQKLMQLYMIPFLYDDVLREPLGGFLIEILNDSYSRFDPEKTHWNFFKISLKSHLSGELPTLSIFDQR
ncbi:MAG: hypothetical protein ACO3LE_03345 [Bdellovibrionota bacterium]